MRLLGIDSAIDAFVGGFTFTRSFTHPYVASTVDGLRVLRDGPRRRPTYRREEWVATTEPPADVDRIVRRAAAGRFALCVVVPIGNSVEACRDTYKPLGYRLGGTEPLMVHDLARIPRTPSPAAIERVLTIDAADRLNRVTKSRQVLPEHLTADAPLRQYMATVDGQVVGWVRSIVVGDATWTSNMHVIPTFRRRGIGRALLGRMLRDDRSNGAKRAVLLASHTGAKLYETIGFRQIATLLVFNPKC